MLWKSYIALRGPLISNFSVYFIQVTRNIITNFEWHALSNGTLNNMSFVNYPKFYFMI